MERHVSGSDELFLYTYVSQITTYLDTTKKNLKLLEGYSSDKDYNIFIKSSPETQKTNLSLVQDAVKHTLKSVKECFDEQLFPKVPADFTFKLSQQKFDSEIVPWARTSLSQLKDLNNQDISSQISTINQIIQRYDETYRKVY